MNDVEGRVAFVTGGNSGIGLGIARAFADAGMKVVIGYRNGDHLQDALQHFQSCRDRVHAIKVDVTDRAAMQRAAQEAVEKFGKIHVIVNNAGVYLPAPLSKTTYQDWDWEININLNGVFNGIHEFLPHIRAHGEGGQIISTSSILGLYGGMGAYTASKFAVVGLMEALAFELAGTNIGVSIFCPGTVDTNVANWKRNRPQIAEAVTAGTEADPSGWNNSDTNISALQAGQIVLEGMRNNDLYIISHPEYGSRIRQRNEAVAASIPVPVSLSPGRTEILNKDLGETIYANALRRREAL